MFLESDFDIYLHATTWLHCIKQYTQPHVNTSADFFCPISVILLVLFYPRHGFKRNVCRRTQQKCMGRDYPLPHAFVSCCANDGHELLGHYSHHCHTQAAPSRKLSHLLTGRYRPFGGRISHALQHCLHCDGHVGHG